MDIDIKLTTWNGTLTTDLAFCNTICGTNNAPESLGLITLSVVRNSNELENNISTCVF
jgi:hypothetical protein